MSAGQTTRYVCQVCHRDRFTSAALIPERCYPCQLNARTYARHTAQRAAAGR